MPVGGFHTLFRFEEGDPHKSWGLLQVGVDRSRLWPDTSLCEGLVLLLSFRLNLEDVKRSAKIIWTVVLSVLFFFVFVPLGRYDGIIALAIIAAFIGALRGIWKKRAEE